MATSASLVVRISADINDFSKKLDKATKDVDRAAKKITDVGKALTIGITAPVAAAAVALSKMAAENEDTAGRVSRVFGGMAASIEGSITTMMQSVPEARTELENMAVSIDNMLQGMDLAPQTAAAMSESLLKLAGDASAFAHVPMEQALDALGRGMAGKTKGLLEFGIAVNESDIKQRAFQMGLIRSGQELTETGTALASYSLIMEKSSRVTGEAGRTAIQSGKEFAFLKRDLIELADNASGLVLPLMSGLAKGARSATGDIAGLSDTTKGWIMGIAGAAAIIGPALLGVSKLAQAYVKLGSAMSLMSKTGSVAALLSRLANPVGLVVTGVLALTAAVWGLVTAYNALHPSSATLLAPLNNDPALDAFLKKSGGVALPGGKNGPTGRDTKLDFEQLKDNADLASKAFDSAIEHGGSLASIFDRIVGLQKQSADLQDKYPLFSKERDAASEVADQMQRISDAVTLSSAPQGAERGLLAAIAGRSFNASAGGALSAVDAASAYRRDLATRSAASQYGVPYNATAEAVIASRSKVTSTDNDFALRESMVKLPDGFDAARQASVEFAEQQRQTSEDMLLSWERTRLAMTTFAGFSLQAGQLLGGLASRVGGGGVLGGIGSSLGGGLFSGLLDKGSKFLPLLGGVGSVVGAFVGKGLDSLFGGHHKTAVDDSANALDKLADTANKAAEAMYNAVEGFKAAYARFQATTPTVVNNGPSAPPNTPTAPGDPGTIGGGPLSQGVRIGELHLHVGAMNNPADFIRELSSAVESASARGGSTGLQLGFT